MAISAFTVSNIIMHIILISIFIGIFFFTYGATVERDVIKSQVDYFVDDLLGVFKPFTSKLPDNVKEQIKSFNPTLDNSEDIKAAKQNDETKKKAAMGIIALLVVGLLIITIVMKRLDRQGMSKGKIWSKLLKQNLVIIIFVALTEFICINMFGRKYMSVDTNRIKKEVIDHLIDIRDGKQIIISENKLMPSVGSPIQAQGQVQATQQLLEQIQKNTIQEQITRIGQENKKQIN